LAHRRTRAISNGSNWNSCRIGFPRSISNLPSCHEIYRGSLVRWRPFRWHRCADAETHSASR